MDIKFDQHFLVNEKILNLIIENAQISSDDVIFEIGPGKGILTKEILKQNPKKLISVEIDEIFRNILEEVKLKNKNFEFIFSNGLDELDNFEFTKLIANIPYSITEPLYKKILDKKFNFALLVHGKQFYETITRRESRWNYFVNSFYEVDMICEIRGDNFEPTAKVNSVVVKLTPKKKLKPMNNFMQILYSKRGRNVLNALIYSLVEFLSISKKDAKIIVDKLEILDLHNQILDTISNENFCIIANKLKQESIFDNL